MTQTRYERDTAVALQGDGVYTANIDQGWWIFRGPNGGYLAAIATRAMQAAVGDDDRHARSLSLHYTAPPVEGPVRIETTIERAGRSLSTVSMRMWQPKAGERSRPQAEALDSGSGGIQESNERLIMTGLGAFSKPREGWEFQDATMPDVLPPDQASPWERESATRFHEHFEHRDAPRTDMPMGAKGVTGGWLRLKEPQQVDSTVAAMLCDAWPPAFFWRPDSAGMGSGSQAMATVDFAIHLRTTLPLPNAKPDDWTLLSFWSRHAHEGFVEEEGELWSPDGTLIAQSRQLAVLL